MRRTIVAVLAILLFSVAAFARKPDEGCRNGQGSVERKLGSYLLQIKPTPGDSEERSCDAVLLSSNGQKLFGASDTTIAVDPISGASVTNDGTKSLVLEGFSGGAHCCWTYWIVSLGARAGLVREIRNQTPFAFERESGKVYMKTNDGVFDYFDDLPHVDAPMPVVYLELHGKKLTDISSQFLAAYDTSIDSARQILTPERIRAFRTSSVPDMKNISDTTVQWMDTKGMILSVVLNYLYSGREQQAWDTLDEMWPASDRERITQLIVDTKSKGLLSHVQSR